MSISSYFAPRSRCENLVNYVVDRPRAVAHLALSAICTGASCYLSSNWMLGFNSLNLCYRAYSLISGPSSDRECKQNWPNVSLVTARSLEAYQLAPQERAHILSLFEKYPINELTAVGHLLGLDIFTTLKEQGHGDAADHFAKCCLNAYIARNSYNELDEYDTNRFIQDIESFERENKESAPIVKDQLDLWKKLLKDKQKYTNLFINEDGFKLESPPEYQERKGYVDVINLLSSSFGDVKIHNFHVKKEAGKWIEALNDPDPKKFLEALRESHTKVNLVSNLQKNLKKKPRSIQEYQKLQQYIENHTKMDEVFYQSGKLMLSYEANLYGVNRDDLFVRLEKNISAFQEIVPKTKVGELFNLLGKEKLSSRFTIKYRVNQLAETLARVCPHSLLKLMNLRTNLTNKEWFTFPSTESLKRRLEEAYKESVAHVHGLEASAQEQYRTDYHKEAMLFARAYLFIQDVEKLQNDEFSEDPIRTIKNSGILNYLDLEVRETNSEQKTAARDLKDTSNLLGERQLRNRSKIKTRSQKPETISSTTEELESENSQGKIQRPRLPNRHDLLIKEMKEFGFFQIRQRGSHQTWSDPDGRKVTLAPHGSRTIYRPGTLRSIEKNVFEMKS